MTFALCSPYDRHFMTDHNRLNDNVLMMAKRKQPDIVTQAELNRLCAMGYAVHYERVRIRERLEAGARIESGPLTFSEENRAVQRTA